MDFQIIYGHTWDTQIEILPRFTIIYSEDKLIAFEWLWFSFAILKE